MSDAPEAYEVRLACRIPRSIDQRLRLLAAMRRRSIARVLAEVLAAALPTADQLAEQLHQGGAHDER